MMNSNKDRQARRRGLAGRRPPLTPEEQRRRQVQADINRQLRRWPPRRVAAWTLFVVSVLVAAQHVMAHAGVRPVPLSMGWQDLLMGYPVAGAIFIGGLFVLEPRKAS